ncbi:invasion associated locus B family protein [Cognatishimia maritima]|uniref:Invasion protein IalB, involved in pathogenesis n=1 Tax=Cognatishimia maritima TaxID=870908 RepID=A0A1M5IM79_9RHOB|nr:invasion associated locus B family protein [Cognatishimia maritima]SHG29361.1 Invasion protein IalB, involved in pathogenesis [Cognatishimia maritima]
MINKIKNHLAAAIIALPTAILAQEQAPATGDLAQGQPVVPEITSETFGDWTVNCQALETGERCQMYQLLKNQDGDAVIEVNLFRVVDQPAVFAGGSIVAPLETLLPPQLTIAIDDGAGKRYPFAFCLVKGCVSRVGLTEEDVNAYKRGAKASVAIVPAVAPDQVVVVDMSLTGFTAAFDRISQ